MDIPSLTYKSLSYYAIGKFADGTLIGRTSTGTGAYYSKDYGETWTAYSPSGIFICMVEDRALFSNSSGFYYFDSNGGTTLAKSYQTYNYNANCYISGVYFNGYIFIARLGIFTFSFNPGIIRCTTDFSEMTEIASRDCSGGYSMVYAGLANDRYDGKYPVFVSCRSTYNGSRFDVITYRINNDGTGTVKDTQSLSDTGFFKNYQETDDYGLVLAFENKVWFTRGGSSYANITLGTLSAGDTIQNVMVNRVGPYNWLAATGKLGIFQIMSHNYDSIIYGEIRYRATLDTDTGGSYSILAGTEYVGDGSHTDEGQVWATLKTSSGYTTVYNLAGSSELITGNFYLPPGMKIDNSDRSIIGEKSAYKIISSLVSSGVHIRNAAGKNINIKAYASTDTPPNTRHVHVKTSSGEKILYDNALAPLTGSCGGFYNGKSKMHFYGSEE